MHVCVCVYQAMLRLRALAAQGLYMQIKIVPCKKKLLLELQTSPIVSEHNMELYQISAQ